MSAMKGHNANASNSELEKKQLYTYCPPSLASMLCKVKEKHIYYIHKGLSLSFKTKQDTWKCLEIKCYQIDVGGSPE